MTKQYAERDAMALDEAGGYYMRHVMAMTGEKLHGKGDIAAELGWRDMQIAALQQKLDAVLPENVALKESRKRLGEFIIEEIDAEYPLNMEIQTPATDAILNEVRAEGVEMFAGHWESNCAHDDTFVGKKAKHFAAQLRAGSAEGGAL